jgi:hypothetical protein
VIEGALELLFCIEELLREERVYTSSELFALDTCDEFAPDESVVDDGCSARLLAAIELGVGLFTVGPPPPVPSDEPPPPQATKPVAINSRKKLRKILLTFLTLLHIYNTVIFNVVFKGTIFH